MADMHHLRECFSSKYMLHVVKPTSERGNICGHAWQHPWPHLVLWSYKWTVPYSIHVFHNIHFTVLPIILFLYCRLVRMLVTYVLFKDTVDWMNRLLIICILVYKYHIFLYCKLVRVQVIEIMFKDTVDWTKRLVIIYWYTTVLSIINHNNGSAREQLKSCETRKVF